MTLSVWNPTLLTSTPVTMHVSGTSAAGTPSGLAAPNLLLPPTSCSTPFLGPEKIYGSNFLPGAVAVVTDANSR